MAPRHTLQRPDTPETVIYIGRELRTRFFNLPGVSSSSVGAKYAFWPIVCRLSKALLEIYIIFLQQTKQISPAFGHRPLQKQHRNTSVIQAAKNRPFVKQRGRGHRGKEGGHQVNLIYRLPPPPPRAHSPLDSRGSREKKHLDFFPGK